MTPGMLNRAAVAAGASLIGLFFSAFLLLGGPSLSTAFAGQTEKRYECSYYRTGEKDLMTEQDCLTYPANLHATGDAVVSETVRAAAAYDKDGLAYLFSPAGVFYFTKAGLARKTLLFDNGPDYFSEGLARFERNGKIGFFDKSLSVVIGPLYDFAYPFRKGLSVVCTGCSPERSGEHTGIRGGKWGLIDKRGAVVQPVERSRQQIDETPR